MRGYNRTAAPAGAVVKQAARQGPILLALVLAGCVLPSSPPLLRQESPVVVGESCQPSIARAVAEGQPENEAPTLPGCSPEPIPVDGATHPPSGGPPARLAFHESSLMDLLTRRDLIDDPSQVTEEAKDKDKDKDANPDAERQKDQDRWLSVHGQGTIVTEVHDHFRSPYMGTNSLIPVEPAATTETATLFLDARLWHGGEIIFNPEISGGTGFSGTLGLAGFPNGEATRVGILQPTPYIARLFFRQTWGLDVEREKVEDGPNQIGGIRDIDRITLTVGKLTATDIADNNRYSHDPRTQFLNWSLMYNGAWDYPANLRGYTYGVALEFNTYYWALHYGIFAEPTVAQGQALDPHFVKANGQILELEEHYTLGQHPGAIREWVFLNHAHMGKYSLALEEMPVDPELPPTRSYRYKYGFGANLEQELTRDLGLFVKVGWDDGQSESWAFTEIDRTVAVGLLLQGREWSRPQDQFGLAVVLNGLAPEHRAYLAAGGIGFIIGDGALNYGLEEIVESYYNIELRKGINVTADFQWVNNPAFNRDRGPVAIGGLRVHFEY
jgi:high affinity Mn2+ porin